MKQTTSTSPSNKRYRSPNGQSRPYRDGNRFKLRINFQYPDGTKDFVVGSAWNQNDCIRNANKLVEKRLAQFHATNKTIDSVGDFCRHWLANVRPLLPIKYKTQVGYETSIRIHIQPNIGDVSITDLRREHIQRMYSSLLANGKSRSVLKDIRAVLNGALDEAVFSGIIPVNPSRTVKIPKRKTPEIKHLTREQATKVLTLARSKGEGARWGVALILAVRQGERCALRWEDLELDSPAPKMFIRHTLVRMTGKGLVLTSVKTDESERTLMIPPLLAEELRKHRIQQKKLRLQAGQIWRESGFVFTTPRGTPIDPANDRKHWIELLKESGVPVIKQHGARSTAATLMYADGIDIHSVSSVMGHADISTTAEYYTHVGADTKLKAVSTIDGLLAGNDTP